LGEVANATPQTGASVDHHLLRPVGGASPNVGRARRCRGSFGLHVSSALEMHGALPIRCPNPGMARPRDAKITPMRRFCNKDRAARSRLLSLSGGRTGERLAQRERQTFFGRGSWRVRGRNLPATAIENRRIRIVTLE